MYARKENNEIKRYNKLPKEIRIEAEDRWVQLTEQNCAQYGFKPIEFPNYNTRTHKRTINLVETETGFTYEVVSLNKTLADLKKELFAELKGYWKTAFKEGKPYTDFLKATGQQMPSDVQTEIDKAYGLLSTIKAQIETLSTVEDAAAYELPMTEINAAIKYLKELI